jgi:hypothetical protein
MFKQQIPSGQPRTLRSIAQSAADPANFPPDVAPAPVSSTTISKAEPQPFTSLKKHPPKGL